MTATEITTGDREARFSEFWKHRLESNIRVRQHIMRDWRLTLQAIGDLLSLQRLELNVSSSSGGLMIEQSLRRSVFGVFTLAQTGACVLSVPKVSGEYSLGASKQTLRRKSRSAEKSGIACRVINDEIEQINLIGQLDSALVSKADLRYRNSHADHRFLVGVGLWSVAYGQNGEPLVIAVVPREGTWALLRLFISLGQTPQHSDARYLLTQFVVERLSHEGVQHLVDTVGPSELTAGLQHFQRMLGFRIARVKFIHDARPWSIKNAGKILKVIYRAIAYNNRPGFAEIAGSIAHDAAVTKS
ncbi:hypothetical protein FV226_27310 [Methylobacterium sp. WL12]|uniref:hypothetical protein n=1 Tax=Methylobacterium sp. WL12 TaxID=2603890 RepID=UPI0011CB4A89|nr:hypothetical protein [Methylobacterium sp. WL12]TXM63735.1 hypothetical protein FV226_27310 [Methylobacterium sp. WL12]